MLLVVQAHPLQQGEFEEVRAAEGDVDLLRGKQQLAGGVIGEQQEKILGQQHGPETRTERVRGATLCSRARQVPAELAEDEETGDDKQRVVRSIVAGVRALLRTQTA